MKIRMKLINLLGNKALVNSDHISTLAHSIIQYYEITAVELINMCFEQKLISKYKLITRTYRTITYLNCFCNRQDLEFDTFTFHSHCAFVSWLSTVYELPLRTNTLRGGAACAKHLPTNNLEDGITPGIMLSYH